MQIKITTRYDFTCSSTALRIKTGTKKHQRGCGETGPLVHFAGGNVHSAATLGKGLAISWLKTKLP